MGCVYDVSLLHIYTRLRASWGKGKLRPLSSLGGHRKQVGGVISNWKDLIVFLYPPLTHWSLSLLLPCHCSQC